MVVKIFPREILGTQLKIKITLEKQTSVVNNNNRQQKKLELQFSVMLYCHHIKAV